MRWQIIDTHCHTGSAEPERTADELAAAARENGIVHALLLGDVYVHGPTPTPAQVSAINDATLVSVRRQPGFFSGLCFLNPQNPPGTQRDEIRRCVRDGGFVGVKLETSLRASDPGMDTLMEEAAALGVPVLQHAWYKSRVDNDLESTPADVADLARRHPGVTIVMAHLGGHGIRGVLDVADLPTVCVDTSGSQPMTGMVEYAVEVLGAHRVLYGTEAPGRDFAAQIGRVLGARISDEERGLVFSGNARRVFGIGAS